MKKTRIGLRMAVFSCVVFVLFSFTTGGCFPGGLGQNATLDEVLLEYRNALSTASEKVTFTEFVKYHELGKQSVMLYVSPEPYAITINVEKTVKKSGGANLNFVPGATVVPGGQVNMEVAKKESGTIALKLVSVGKDPCLYNTIINIFNAHPPEGIYKETDRLEDCQGALYCIKIEGSGSPQYAYLPSDRNYIIAFRALMNDILSLDPKTLKTIGKKKDFAPEGCPQKPDESSYKVTVEPVKILVTPAPK